MKCIKKPLNFIFNESINKGVCSRFNEKCKISSVDKTDNRKEISNYRPISGLPIFSKMSEKSLSQISTSLPLNIRFYRNPVWVPQI
jgi:hypothetical protein